MGLKVNSDGKRWCSRLKHYVAPTEFYSRNSWCKYCKSAYGREHYDVEKAKQKNKIQRDKRDSTAYQTLLLKQEGRCAICKATTGLVMDLDTMKEPYGLLCKRCKTAVDFAEDAELWHQYKAYVNGEFQRKV
jgi:hypothetical protein